MRLQPTHSIQQTMASTIPEGTACDSDDSFAAPPATPGTTVSSSSSDEDGIGKIPRIAFTGLTSEEVPKRGSPHPMRVEDGGTTKKVKLSGEEGSRGSPARSGGGGTPTRTVNRKVLTDDLTVAVRQEQRSTYTWALARKRKAPRGEQIALEQEAAAASARVGLLESAAIRGGHTISQWQTLLSKAQEEATEYLVGNWEGVEYLEIKNLIERNRLRARYSNKLKNLRKTRLPVKKPTKSSGRTLSDLTVNEQDKARDKGYQEAKRAIEKQAENAEEESFNSQTGSKTKVSKLAFHIPVEEQLWNCPITETTAAEYGPLVSASVLPKYKGDFGDDLTIIEWLRKISELFFAVAGVPADKAVNIVSQCFPESSPARIFFTKFMRKRPGRTFHDLAEGLVKEYLGNHLDEKYSAELHALKQGNSSVTDFVIQHTRLWGRVNPNLGEESRLIDLPKKLNEVNTNEFMIWEIRQKRQGKTLTMHDLLSWLTQKERQRLSTPAKLVAAAIPAIETTLAVTQPSGRPQWERPRDPRKRRDRESRGSSPKLKSFEDPNCKRCGATPPHNKDECGAKTNSCMGCREKGHYKGSPMCINTH